MTTLGVPVAVLDVETTGIYPGRDRIVEVAVVRYDAAGELDEVFTTLVNPLRDVGPSDIHGIWASDVAEAPDVASVLGEVYRLLAGAVIVGHNVRFDLSFLVQEALRAGDVLPAVCHVCTLSLSRRLMPGLRRRTLSACCKEAGIEHDDEHTALGDARATARLFWHHVAVCGPALNLGTLGAVDVSGLHSPFPPRRCQTTAAPLTRQVARERKRAEDRMPMRFILDRLDLGGLEAPEVLAYVELLERVLEDRRITTDERDALIEVGLSLGLTRQRAREVNLAFMRAVVVAALLDAEITPAERRDIDLLTDLLDLQVAEVDGLLSEEAAIRATAREAGVAAVGSILAGKRICFTGALASSLDGKRLTRSHAEALVEAAGLTAVDSVTLDLDILVLADPHSQSSKAKKARAYGTRILAEQELWRLLGVRVQ